MERDSVALGRPCMRSTQPACREIPSVPINTSRPCLHELEVGTHCKANARHGSEYCFFHDPLLEQERAIARKAGGIARTRKAVLPAGSPDKRLQTVSDVIELLGETINQVR